MSALVPHVFHRLSSFSQLLEHEDHIPIEDMSWFSLKHVSLYKDIFHLKHHLGTGSGKNDANPAVS